MFTMSRDDHMFTRLVVFLVSFLIAGEARAHYPLEPPDRSSPRGTIAGFLEVTDALGQAGVAYKENPGPETASEISGYLRQSQGYFDLSQVAEAARYEVADEAGTMMWEVLSRIELPPLAEIPDQAMMKASIEEGRPPRYTIPHTEITIAQIEKGEAAGEYLFSPRTVRRVREFFEQVKDLPYVRKVTIERPRRLEMLWGGWLLMPPKRAEALPAWLRADMGQQAIWKWLALTAILVLALGLSWLVHRLASITARLGSLSSYLPPLTGPATFLILVPMMKYMITYQIWPTGQATAVAEFLVPTLTYIAVARILWLAPLFLAEVMLTSSRLPKKGLDAHLLWLVMRVVSFVGVFLVIFWAGHRLGLPLFGLIAGVGVGGLAIALAAQGTVENFLGSLNLFADRPVRVGDLCQYGDNLGTVEAIGLRSTRIRGLDRTVTSIPNADFSKMKITNYTNRDMMLMRSQIGLRYETKPDQLRHVLANLRELLLTHPKVTAAPARVRLVGFGDTSLNLEIFAYVETHNYDEFLAIQEDLYLRMIDLVVASGTGFALPSRTLYLTRDRGLDPERSAAAMSEVQRWREDEKLPFPNFDPEFRKMHRDMLDYPPVGSSQAARKD